MRGPLCRRSAATLAQDFKEQAAIRERVARWMRGPLRRCSIAILAQDFWAQDVPFGTDECLGGCGPGYPPDFRK